MRLQIQKTNWWIETTQNPPHEAWQKYASSSWRTFQDTHLARLIPLESEVFTSALAVFSSGSLSATLAVPMDPDFERRYHRLEKFETIDRPDELRLPDQAERARNTQIGRLVGFGIAGLVGALCVTPIAKMLIERERIEHPPTTDVPTLVDRIRTQGPSFTLIKDGAAISPRYFQVTGWAMFHSDITRTNPAAPSSEPTKKYHLYTLHQSPEEAQASSNAFSISFLLPEHRDSLASAGSVRGKLADDLGSAEGRKHLPTHAQPAKAKILFMRSSDPKSPSYPLVSSNSVRLAVLDVQAED